MTPTFRASSRTRRIPLRTRLAISFFGAMAFVGTGRVITQAFSARTPEALAGAPTTPALALAGRSRLGRGIRSGFTSEASETIHTLVTAFEARRVDVLANLVDVDYELDYHRLLHELEAQFSRTDNIRLAMSVVSVEPLPEGFSVEVEWQKTYRVRRTGHKVHEEGASRLVFVGEQTHRLLAIRGEMPF